jgi:hypothetical protein
MESSLIEYHAGFAELVLLCNATKNNLDIQHLSCIADWLRKAISSNMIIDYKRRVSGKHQ